MDITNLTTPPLTAEHIKRIMPVVEGMYNDAMMGMPTILTKKEGASQAEFLASVSDSVNVFDGMLAGQGESRVEEVEEGFRVTVDLNEGFDDGENY